ncbi:MAG: T9SS type A sorting domain-containing protein, partial [Salinivirgaceae bacterium]|nr:T9SS type A sorting domain-containing protein [Salinivirgaceae bacterium]
SAGDGLTGGTYTVRLDPGSIQTINTPANIRILKRETPAEDIASNYTTWINGNNNGFGFEPWVLTIDGATAGHDIQSSITSGHANLDQDGKSFRMYGYGVNDTAHAERAITSWGDGYTFSVDMAVQLRDGKKGIRLYNGSSLIWSFNITDAGYGTTGWIERSDMLLKFKATQNGADLLVQVTGISKLNIWTDIFEDTVTGQTLTKFQIFTGGASNSDGKSDLYFNNLSVAKPWEYNGAFSYADPLFEQSGLTGFSEFSLAGNSTDNPLPIRLLYFRAQRLMDHIQLRWATVSEQNNQLFTVERSQDMTTWNVVGTLAGAGNSSDLLTYSLVDFNPLPSTAYYRLKQTDFNGSTSYSDIVTVSNSHSDINNIILFPNPSKGNVTVLGLDQSAQVSIYNTVGELILQRTIEPDSNTIDLSQHSNGIYFISIVANGELKNSKIIISK